MIKETRIRRTMPIPTLEVRHTLSRHKQGQIIEFVILPTWKWKISRFPLSPTPSILGILGILAAWRLGRLMADVGVLGCQQQTLLSSALLTSTNSAWLMGPAKCNGIGDSHSYPPSHFGLVRRPRKLTATSYQSPATTPDLPRLDEP